MTDHTGPMQPDREDKPMRESEIKSKNHGEIVVRDYNGYSVYCCADCGQDINNPTCSARRQTQPNPPTFDSLLADPTQQLDPNGEVLAQVLESRDE